MECKVFPREQAQQVCAALYDLIIKTASLDSSNKTWDDIVSFLEEAGIPVSEKMDAEMREVENSLKTLGLE